MTKYLLIGHITEDLTPSGTQLGGTVSYAGLTAKVLGADVRVLTACHANTDLSPLSSLDFIRLSSEHTTTFENLQTSSGRVQNVHAVAKPIPTQAILKFANGMDIIHCAPLLQEFESAILPELPRNVFTGVTPQGWMRTLGERGRVQKVPWLPSAAVLACVDALVFSEEDFDPSSGMLELYRNHCPLVAMTRGEKGALIFTHRQTYDLPAPRMEVCDTIGAGDIFASAFFYTIKLGVLPQTAGAYAVALASASVTRRALNSIPTAQEIQYNSGILQSS